MKQIFEPRTVALIGASRDELSVGHGIIKNLIYGGVFKTQYNIPFKGKTYLVNPNAKSILGLKCYPSILNIKSRIDLAIIAVPASFVPSIVKDCIKKKVKGIIVISAGFSETGPKGRKLQEQILKDVTKANIPLIGPNCLGIINTKHINASFAPSTPPQGHIGFITQSGALADSIIDWAIEKNYGFSKIISVGNSASKDVSDFISYLAKDKDTKSITIYLEALNNGKKFMQAVKKCKKPIVILKGGKTDFGKEAITTHTGTLAGSYKVYNAAFKQLGITIVEDIESLFLYAKLLSEFKKIKNNIAIITNGGGCGVVTADLCSAEGINLAKLSPSTLQKLDASGKMHPAYSRSNPLDIIGDALSIRYKTALDCVLSQKNISAAIVIQTLQTMTDPVENAKVIVKLKKKYPKKPIIALFMGGKFTKAGKHYLEIYNIPVFEFPNKAVKALKALIK
ncbi:hypothetical protein D6777_01505 [Candidatus Woesearchaeota archaeon]|nr:MAG: hypothetical protein D6777_01505 [Candidatus Woesearchaeota archaeon]